MQLRTAIPLSPGDYAHTLPCPHPLELRLCELPALGPGCKMLPVFSSSFDDDLIFHPGVYNIPTIQIGTPVRLHQSYFRITAGRSYPQYWSQIIYERLIHLQDTTTHCMDSALSYDANPTLGAYLIGVLISYVLLGVVTTQVYMYYSCFPEDSLKLKALVAFVWTCEVAHALCMGHALYQFTVMDHLHPQLDAGPLPQSLDAVVFFSGIIAACVQGFFSFRIYALCKKRYIPIILWCLAFLHLLGSTVVFVATLRMASIASYEVHWGWLSTALWCIGAAADFLTAATLVTYLYGQRTNAQRRMISVVDKIILWTIERGILTSASGIVMAICFAVMPHNLTWLAVFVVVSRLYSNSLLARLAICIFYHANHKLMRDLVCSLNARVTLRAMNDLEVSLQFLTPAVTLPRDGVQITKATEIRYDIDRDL
ncbi:hypothetical protein MVEN_01391600 [Mycena venus]|uniref:DUF6534 domain-containing protein n=1 Tax=Mycena venus TaxID=2733690 RepID=A0A8H6XYI4_9AGAR|nr:hypothetical protein MVEN_01391600 [Mycena venus]